MDFDAVKNIIKNGPSMSFEQIASQLGMSASGVYRLYIKALKKIKEELTEEQKEEIIELLREEDTAYETMLEAWALQQDRGLHGFWNEKEK